MTNILARNEDPGVGGPRTRPEFGIGLGAGLGVGYRLACNALGFAPTLRLTHTRHWTSIPVSEAPNKRWNFGSTSLLLGLEW
ncbi:MAG: hypothetical protein IPF99_30120 [Deltaproteobacteria bacterium]|nr:hypothetical protein [Deltaproteobacteria bacterium]